MTLKNWDDSGADGIYRSDDFKASYVIEADVTHNTHNLLRCSASVLELIHLSASLDREIILIFHIPSRWNEMQPTFTLKASYLTKTVIQKQ